jgi:hypothetical protein
MNKPSERIVVFVTPAQKRAIASTAEGLGISVSELMRRAVLNFGATSEQVKAASIVDRLRAPREPDALNEALRKAARGTRHTHPAEPAALPPGLVPVKPAPGAVGQAGHVDAAHAPSHADAAPIDGTHAPAEDLPDSPAFDPATATEEEMRNAAEAVARVAAAKAASLAAHPPGASDALRPRSRIDTEHDADSDPHGDPATDGRFA